MNMNYNQYAKIVRDGLDAGKHQDEIMGELVKAGLNFSEVKRFFLEVGQELGALLSNKDKKVIITNLIDDSLTKGDNLTYQQYKALENEISLQVDFEVSNLFKKVYVEITGNQPQKRKNNVFSGQYKKLCDWLLENPLASEEEIKAAKIRLIGSSGDHDNQVIKMRNFMHEFYPVYMAAKGE